MATGKLYICGTPIGNLEDASIRLIRTLRQVEIIACEDTRQTIKLLNRYNIKKKMISYHQYSGPRKKEHLLEKLIQGLDIALVSDAGMPTISDPGQELVRGAVLAGIDVEVVPGPSAFTAALAISGFNNGCFFFGGFLPNRSSRRREVLEQVKTIPGLLIFYEAPHRLLAALGDLEHIFGSQQEIAIARELTKLHEEVIRGTVGDLKQYYSQNTPRGELCLLINERKSLIEEVDMEQIFQETAELIKKGIDKKEAFKIKARQYKIKKSTLYNYFIDRDIGI